jgi:hypothetical protein
VSSELTDQQLAIGMARLMKGDTVRCDSCGHEMRLGDPMPDVRLETAESVSGVVKTPLYQCEECGQFGARGLSETMEQTNQ